MTRTCAHLPVSRHLSVCLATLLFSTEWQAFAVPANQSTGNVPLDTSGHTFSFTVTGLQDLRAGFSATIVRGGQTQELASAAGSLAEPVVQTHEDTPFGRAEVTSLALHFENAQIDVLFRLSRVPGVPGVVAQAGIRNVGKAPVALAAVTPVALECRTAGSWSDWLVTSLVTSSQHATSVVAVADIREPLWVEEYGGFYRSDGAGFLFGPVGTPSAFLYTAVARDDGARVSLTVRADMSGVQVDPGESRWGQQAALLTLPPRQALACWAKWVARTHGARTDKGALSGWSSWYFLGREVTGKDVEAVASAAVKWPDRLHPDVIQIDRGYSPLGERKVLDDKFPEGLDFYAKCIAATGARPGLRVPAVAPSPSDNSAQRFSELLSQCREAVKAGFDYLKFDVNFHSAPFASGSGAGKKTSFEAVRERFEAVRAAAGTNTYLMCCDSWPNRAEVGFADASRTGHASIRVGVRIAMDDMLRSFHLNGRWFAVDNHAFYMGTDVANVSQIAGGWPLVRTWMSMVGLSCGSAITSDPWHWEDFKPYWRNVEVLTPPANERTEVLDLCTSRDWPRLVGHVTRDWGDRTVALLWNPGSAERTVTLDFAKAGLNPSRRYAVWSFWDNRYLGVAEKAWTTTTLAPSASQHLCFTDLDRTPGRPVLIGSGLHIYCGAAEIKRVISRRSTMEIELTDAGSREGDLFVYSRSPLVWKASDGCTVTGIASAGEYVWRVSIVGRQNGLPQRLALSVLLPVTQQAWFWSLIALVLASLLLTGWRYVASQRLKREHVLDQERARIARDLHDDLGAGLTEITMLSDVAQQDCDRPAAVSTHLERIFQSGSEMAQALDEIVWAVNPSNDTLEKLISFTCEFAQSMLGSAGIRCRLDAPAAVPALHVNSTIRHQLCMALKECLHNAIKHACAHEVSLCIRHSGQMLDVTVADDGKGFDPAALQDRAGTHDGLRNLKQRMSVLGGTCEIQSAPGQGTRVQLRVRV